MIVCPCCGGVARPLMRHHWRGLDGSLYERMVCTSCNVLLCAANFGFLGPGMNHVLPSWDEQVSFVRGHLVGWRRREARSEVRRYEGYAEELVLLRRWLSRRHFGAELRFLESRGLDEAVATALVERRVAWLEERIRGFEEVSVGKAKDVQG